MNKCKVFIPVGALGSGIDEGAFREGMELKPDIISCDAGSTDSGPYYLGTGRGKYARSSVKNDLRMVLHGAMEAHIPITIGSACTCGADSAVDEMADICREICREDRLSLKMVLIYSEQDREIMKQRYVEGSIKPLPGAPKINERTFDECSHIVALSGTEPFIKALSEGADIVICGRATDTAVIAALPIMKGCNVAAAWHGAKVCECGGLCTTNPVGSAVFMTVDDKGFEVKAVGKDAECTVYTVSSHLLYENSDPIHLTEPGIQIDVTDAVYTQLEDGSVRVEGTRAVKSEQYTMKLEGSGPAGYQTIILAGIRDREIMKAPYVWIDKLSAFIDQKLEKLGFDKEKYSYTIRPYGYNAVYGGDVPEGYVPNELGMLLVVTAETQEMATQICKVFNPYMLHYPIRENIPLPSYAFPFSPSEIQRGQIYEFKLNHVVEISDPLELVRFSEEELKND